MLLLLQDRKHTGDELARRFEVSRRTVMRDIQALCEMGMPVTAEWGPNGGYSLPSGTVRQLTLSRGEALHLLLALRVLPGPAENSRSLRSSLEAKLGALIPPALLEPLERLTARVDPSAAGASTAPLPHADALLAALGDDSWVEIDYRSVRGASTQRLAPRRLYPEAGFWYLEAYSAERGEVRTFRTDRIRAVRPVPAPADASAAAATAAEYGDPRLPEAVIALTPRGALEAERALSRFPIVREPDGAFIRVRCPLHEYDWLARAILSLGTEARVVTPPELVRQVHELARAVAAAHAENAENR